MKEKLAYRKPEEASTLLLFEKTNNSDQKSGQGKTPKETSCPYDKPETFMKNFSLLGSRNDDPSYILEENFEIPKKFCWVF